LLTPCEMKFRMSRRVMPWADSSVAAYERDCCIRAARMSPARTSSRPALCTCSTAAWSVRRKATVCSGSLSSRRELLKTFAQKRVELPPQARDVAAACGEDLLALHVVSHHVEQVLQREVRVAPRDGLAVRDVQQHFDRRAEHGQRPFPGSSRTV